MGKNNFNAKIFSFTVLVNQYREILDNEDNLPYSLIYEENY